MRRRLLFALSFIVWAGLAHAMTLSDLITSVRRNLRDTASDTTLQRYSDSVITSVLNEGQQDVAFRTWLVEKSTTIVIVQAQSAYTVPADFLADAHVYRTYSGAGYYDLEKKSRLKVFEDTPDWEVTSGTPTAYWISDNLTSGTRAQIKLVPVPGAPGGSDTLVLHYYCQPTDLSLSSDVPFNGQLNLYEFHKILSYYASADLFLREENLPMADYYEKRYESILEEISDRLGRVHNSPKVASPEKK